MFVCICSQTKLFKLYKWPPSLQIYDLYIKAGFIFPPWNTWPVALIPVCSIKDICLSEVQPACNNIFACTYRLYLRYKRRHLFLLKSLYSASCSHAEGLCKQDIYNLKAQDKYLLYLSLTHTHDRQGLLSYWAQHQCASSLVRCLKLLLGREVSVRDGWWGWRENRAANPGDCWAALMHQIHRCCRHREPDWLPAAGSTPFIHPQFSTFSCSCFTLESLSYQ